MKPILTSCLSAALAFLLLPAAAPGAEVRPQINYIYYPVPYAPGLSAAELILRHSPRASGGRRFSGYTRYSIRYEVGYTQPTIDVCRVASPRVLCDCEITLPRLEGAESDPETRRQFEAELNRINRHEQTHCDIAVRHAQALLEIIKKLKDMPCPETNQVLSARLREVEAACSVDQGRFDHSEYGYKDHLRAEGLQRMMDAGFNPFPAAEAEPEPGAWAIGRPSNFQSVAPPNAQEFDQKGIYKDENGVWRNY